MTLQANPADAEPFRFAFGRNWARFLEGLDEARIRTAVDSLRDMLGVDDLRGKRFLDAGSGSGLFSLAARRLGARVHSFDYDAGSVACTEHLRATYFPGDAEWTVDRASVLDAAYLETLGTADVVYCWGMLHHTGHMWDGLENVCARVAPGGTLFVSIYNDQGGASRRWRRVKRLYNRLPRALRFVVVVPALAHIWWKPSLRDLLQRRPGRTWREYGGDRGMSPWWDLLDWVGGFPFEVAKPEEIFEFCTRRGFRLLRLSTHGGGPDCNEYVFVRAGGEAA
ncbi:MAG: methyltransferase type 12 [Gemmatimonadetes bacterium]|nr:methyltransferase type 12 [Gemmatimonadota bacterium]